MCGGSLNLYHMAPLNANRSRGQVIGDGGTESRGKLKLGKKPPENGLFQAGGKLGGAGDTKQEIDAPGFRYLNRHARFYRWSIQPEFPFQFFEISPGVFDIRGSLFLPGLEQQPFGGPPVIIGAEGDGDDMQAKLSGIRFVRQRMIEDETVRDHHGPAGILMGGLAGADFQDGGGQGVMVHDIASNAAYFNSIAERIGLGQQSETGSAEAINQFLGGDD